MLTGAGNSGSVEGAGGIDLSPVVLAHEAPFKIADVEVRPATREILRADDCHVVEPRVMQLLVALHRAAGGVVSKDDLAHLVWEGRIVGEDAINRVVSRLRSVAANQADGAFKVETITKVGYRLRPANGGQLPGDRGRASSFMPTTPSSLTRRDTLVLAGAVATVAAAGSALWLKRTAADGVPAKARPLVAAAELALYENTTDGDSNAIGALRQALAIAPDNARIWGLLGSAYMSASRSAPVQSSQEFRNRAVGAIQRSFSIEPGQPDALAGQISGMRVFGNWLAVERAARAGLRSHPNHIGLKQKLVYVLAQSGRTREALPIFQDLASRLPSVAHMHAPEVTALWSLGRLDEADAAINAYLARWPRYWSLWFTALYLKMYTGRPVEALAMIRDLTSRPTGIPNWNFENLERSAAALSSGDRTRIAEANRANVELAHRGTGFAENAANFAAFIGDFDTAFAVLNALYFNEGFAMPDAYFSPEQGMYSGTDRHTYNLFVWQMRALRRDPRFAALTRRLGLDDYWQASGSRAMVTP